MTSYYKSYMPDPNDPNRRRRKETLPEDGTWPRSLRWGYVLVVVACVAMLVHGALMLSLGYVGDPAATPERQQWFMTNMRIVAWWNIGAGLTMSLFAAQLRTGSRMSRRVLTVLIALTMFINMAGFIILVSGLASVAITVLLAFALLFMYRPVANEFIREAQ